MSTLTTLALLVLAASGDPETPKGSCADYVANYRSLLRDRADAERNLSEEPPAGASAAFAQRDADRVVELQRAQLERSCRAANRSEWECVVDATTYSDLGACRVKDLPVVAETLRVRDARAKLEAQLAPQRTDPELVVQSWISRGTVDVSPDMKRAAFEERRDEAAAAKERR